MNLDKDKLLESIASDLLDYADTLTYPIGMIGGRQIQIVVTRDPDRLLDPVPALECLTD